MPPAYGRRSHALGLSARRGHQVSGKNNGTRRTRRTRRAEPAQRIPPHVFRSRRVDPHAAESPAAVPPYGFKNTVRVPYPATTPPRNRGTRNMNTSAVHRTDGSRPHIE